MIQWRNCKKYNNKTDLKTILILFLKFPFNHEKSFSHKQQSCNLDLLKRYSSISSYKVLVMLSGFQGGYTSCYYQSKEHYTLARRYEFYVLVTRTISHSFASLTREILFWHSNIEFISSRHRVISFIYVITALCLAASCQSSRFCHTSVVFVTYI